MSSTNRQPSPEGECKKRVSKACDRCRLKKVKCDGMIPCTRCQHENNVCCYGERKKSVERRIPPGYVEYLEGQQEVLVRALKKAWKEHINPTLQLPSNREHINPTLQLPSNQEPAIHNILEELGVSIDAHNPIRHAEKFEEDLEVVRADLAAKEDIKSPKSICSTPDTLMPDSELTMPTSELTMPNSELTMPTSELSMPTPELSSGNSSDSSTMSPNVSNPQFSAHKLNNLDLQDYFMTDSIALSQMDLRDQDYGGEAFSFADPAGVFDTITASQLVSSNWCDAAEGQLQGQVQMCMDPAMNITSVGFNFDQDWSPQEDVMFNGYIHENPE